MPLQPTNTPLSNTPAGRPAPSGSPDLAARLRITPVSALLLGIGVLVLGNGLQGTLVGVRAGLEGFAPESVGLIMSAYYMGYTAGSLYFPRIIGRVGHIRTFAALASVASAATLTHVLWIDVAGWALLRAVNGACYAGLILVVESWLNGHAVRDTRGRVLSVYGIVMMAAWSASQFLLNLAPAASFELFCLVSILLSLALVPVTLTHSPGPVIHAAAKISLAGLYRISPLGFVGPLVVGLVFSAFWGMGPTYALSIGLGESGVATFLAAGMAGALLLQWPLGQLSDRWDRRGTVLLACAGAGGAALLMALLGDTTSSPASGAVVGLYALVFLFGGLGIPIYSLLIANVNDFFGEEGAVSAAGDLIFLYGIGAALGPMLASLLMGQVGAAGLFGFAGVLLLLLGGFTVAQQILRPAAPRMESYQTLPGTVHAATHMAMELAPRTSDDPSIEVADGHDAARRKGG